MWKFNRQVSLTPRQITLVRGGFVFNIAASGDLLGEVSEEMHEVLRRDSAFVWVSPPPAPQAPLEHETPVQHEAPVQQEAPLTETIEPVVEDVVEPHIESTTKRRGRPKKS